MTSARIKGVGVEVTRGHNVLSIMQKGWPSPSMPLKKRNNCLHTLGALDIQLMVQSVL